jgi:hypothetical protein
MHHLIVSPFLLENKLHKPFVGIPSAQLIISKMPVGILNIKEVTFKVHA